MDTKWTNPESKKTPLKRSRARISLVKPRRECTVGPVLRLSRSPSRRPPTVLARPSQEQAAKLPLPHVPFQFPWASEVGLGVREPTSPGAGADFCIRPALSGEELWPSIRQPLAKSQLSHVPPVMPLESVHPPGLSFSRHKWQITKLRLLTKE